MVEEIEQPFENPEVKKLFDILMDNLLTESGRGALLVATSHIDRYLTELFECVLPKDYPIAQRKQLFKYPGTLSSLSAKIELAYAFRLINKKLYENLTALRRLRNDAAHGSDKFDLHDLEDRLRNIYDMGDGFAFAIRDLAVSALMRVKAHNIGLVFDELGLTDEQKHERWTELFNDKENIKKLTQQAPHWEMIIGLCFLCWMIIHAKSRVEQLTAQSNLWGDLVGKLVKEETDNPA